MHYCPKKQGDIEEDNGIANVKNHNAPRPENYSDEGSDMANNVAEFMCQTN